MDQAITENQNRAGRALRGDQCAVIDEIRDGFIVDDPEGVARGLGIEGCRDRPVGVRALDEHQGAVEFRHFVQKYVEVQRQWLRDTILALVGGKILVPLPDIAGESRLGVYLDLLDV